MIVSILSPLYVLEVTVGEIKKSTRFSSVYIFECRQAPSISVTVELPYNGTLVGLMLFSIMERFSLYRSVLFFRYVFWDEIVARWSDGPLYRGVY